MSYHIPRRKFLIKSMYSTSSSDEFAEEWVNKVINTKDVMHLYGIIRYHSNEKYIIDLISKKINQKYFNKLMSVYESCIYFWKYIDVFIDNGFIVCPRRALKTLKAVENKHIDGFDFAPLTASAVINLLKVTGGKGVTESTLFDIPDIAAFIGRKKNFLSPFITMAHIMYSYFKNPIDARLFVKRGDIIRIVEIDNRFVSMCFIIYSFIALIICLTCPLYFFPLATPLTLPLIGILISRSDFVNTI